MALAGAILGMGGSARADSIFFTAQFNPSFTGTSGPPTHFDLTFGYQPIAGGAITNLFNLTNVDVSSGAAFGVNAANNPNFTGFVQAITDGLNDYRIVASITPDAAGVTPSTALFTPTESAFFASAPRLVGVPDLAGAVITAIELGPTGTFAVGGNTVLAQIPIGFVGLPPFAPSVPEPSAAFLAGLGFFALAAARRFRSVAR